MTRVSLSMNVPSDSIVPVSAYLLADHLDAALAAGEDLLAIAASPGAGPAVAFGHEIAGVRAGQRRVVETIRGLELALIARLLRARERALELAGTDARFKAIASLFVGGTAPLSDAVVECGDASELDFDTGDDVLAYLRQRNLVAGDAEIIEDGAKIDVGDDFLVARRIELGPLLDLTASFLDALELHFDLYEIEVASDMPAPSSAEAA